jgi:two-component system CheB/CheR fusion protein
MADPGLLTGIIHRDDRAVFLAHLDDEHHAGEPQEIVFRIIKKDGSVRYIAHVCTPVFGEAGEYIGRRASNRDVTEQRQTEIKLREGEEVANALINTPGEPVLLIAVDGTIIDANVELAKRVRFGKNRVIGMSMYDIIGRNMVKHRKEKIDTVLETGKALRFEERSGESWFDTIIYPVRDHQGMITKLAIFSHDITETRRLQKDIMEISELERQRIGQDLHDSLGQKLTGIGFLAEALKQTMQEKSYPEVADIEEIIFNVTDSIDQARKISSGLWANRFESYDAAQALEELAIDTRDLFRISCLFNNEINKPVVNKTVVNNLYNIARESVNNAIKHGKADHIELCLNEDDEQIYLSIKDNGWGAMEGFEEKKGIGLRIMRYRAGIIGGSMTVKSADTGFEVFIALKKEFLNNYLN